MRNPGSGKVITASAAALLLCSGAWLSAQQRGADQIPTFRSGVELVSVDVGVLDRQGQPVRGLEPRDFTVTVAGQPRRVVSAEFVDLTAATREAAARSEGTRISTNEGAGVGRLIVFIVDQNTLEPGNVRQVARAASRFFTGLTFADRSALMLIPAGPHMEFTWAHDRVRDALQRVVGLSSPVSAWEFGSLSEARDIANRNLIALRTISQRECGGGFSASAGGLEPMSPTGGSSAPAGATPAPAPGGSSGGGEGGTGTTSGGGGQTSGGTTTQRPPRTSQLGFGTDSCTRDIQMRAEWTWRSAQMTSLASLSALRQALDALARVRGDKTVILISGGWPLDEREQTTLLSTVASDAAAARATVFTLFVPGTTTSASRRTVSSTPANDRYLQAWPLETLAAMTGGGSFRVEVGAESAFERLGRELAGYYRIGVEKNPSDLDGKPRRLKVQVSRGAATVRAREIFDSRTYEDRDWAARLASALDAPTPATAVGLRVTSYITPDAEDRSRLRLVLAGEASRVDPGEATFQLVVHDLAGKKLLTGEQPIGEPLDNGLSFSANLPIDPGSYIVRVAVIDGAGRIGSVDHRADVRPVPLGALSSTGLVLVRVPNPGGGDPRLALDHVRQDERLALQVNLEGDSSHLADAHVLFEIAANPDGPALVQTAAQLSADPRANAMLAQAVADVRVLPHGDYVARARVRSGSEWVGEVRRAFSVTEAPRAVDAAARPAGTTGVVPAAVSRIAPVRPSVRAVVTAPHFALEHVLAPQVLAGFLERVAARPDAQSPMIRELVDRARTAGIEQLPVSDTLASQYPVAAFLRGLTLLAQNKLDHAANAFRNAMRTSADFYPAMVYLGVCYAAGGNDKEAAGAWRTALIKEGDTLALYTMLADALLRQNRGDLALQALETARARWPEDNDVKRRFVLAALLAGEYAGGFQVLDDLIGTRADDEPSLAAGLLVLYEAFLDGRPVDSVEQDRARMLRLAEAYRARGGPSLALIDTWVAAAQGN